MAELHDLFCKKLQQCCVMFDFLDCVADLKGKEIKRAALNELVESVATSRGVLIEPLYPEAIKMVRGPGRELRFVSVRKRRLRPVIAAASPPFPDFRKHLPDPPAQREPGV